MFKDLKVEKIHLHYNDTSRSFDEVSWKRLRPKLVKGLKVFQKFFYARGKNRLDSEVRKSKVIELSVTLCGKSRIKTLNRDYRQKDKATDVLSFPVHESLRENDFVGFSQDVLNLGDIFICREVAQKQSREFKISYEDELIHLLVHGLLHLCGYDHEISKEEEKIMSRFEDLLIKGIGKGK